jgi:hypothetical protein
VTITRRAPRIALLSVVAVALTTATITTGTVGAGAQSSNKLTITATEYTYKFSGSAKPGNVEIVFDNVGVEIHMVAAIALKPGVTLKQLESAFESNDDAAFGKIVKGDGNVPGMPGLNSPGVSTTNITSLKAGHYAILCFVPTSDGSPHIAHGMVKLLDVKGSKSTAKPPSDGVVDVTITDTAITLPSSGIPKSGWIKVTNESKVPRDLTLAKYQTSNTDFANVNAQVDQFFDTGKWPGGQAAVLLNGGVGALPPNGIGYLQVSSLPAGKWVAVSSDNSLDDTDPAPLNTAFTIG